MRILFFIETLRSGGRERRAVELMKALGDSGFEIELVLTEDEIHYKEIHKKVIKIHVIERRLIKKDPSVFHRFFKIANAFAPHVIHTWGTMTTLYALPSSKILKVPLINSEISNTKPMFLKGFRKITFKYSDLITSNTAEGLKAYKAPSSKSAVIYNGFNFNRIKDLQPETETRKKFGITTKYVVAMVGTFYPQKDYGTFINAANKILKVRDDVTFLCIGSGDSGESKAQSLFENRILFLGKQENVESIMSICDIGVLTSNSNLHGEGISNVLLEFCALGKPVIGTNFGGTPELITDNVNGFLVAPFDVEQLVLKITDLLDNEQRKQSMGKNALTIVREKFSIDKMVMAFVDEYKKLKKRNEYLEKN